MLSTSFALELDFLCLKLNTSQLIPIWQGGAGGEDLIFFDKFQTTVFSVQLSLLIAYSGLIISFQFPALMRNIKDTHKMIGSELFPPK